jgi:hypothetical protein
VAPETGLVRIDPIEIVNWVGRDWKPVPKPGRIDVGSCSVSARGRDRSSR